MVVGSLITACSAFQLQMVVGALLALHHSAYPPSYPCLVVRGTRGERDHRLVKTAPKPWARRSFESLSIALSWADSFMLYHVFAEHAQRG